jgi:5-(carboxyamino)imidazole ribonucleotide mutase
MPKGIPVATFAIGKAGSINAALFAISMLSVFDRDVADKLEVFRQKQKNAVLEMTLPPVNK